MQDAERADDPRRNGGPMRRVQSQAANPKAIQHHHVSPCHRQCQRDYQRDETGVPAPPIETKIRDPHAAKSAYIPQQRGGEQNAHEPSEEHARRVSTKHRFG